ncbi:putative protein TIC 214 N-terminal part [Phoenix dactylifera]|uniref:Protein TIC 214 n=1 Tax=Phoenix dactylifera TaxID=42345 RepID=A0A8B7BK71_PHODC|nr:putative protein TIC 214 N-terminal part [Phoenix dactylifera]
MGFSLVQGSWIRKSTSTHSDLPSTEIPSSSHSAPPSIPSSEIPADSDIPSSQPAPQIAPTIFDSEFVETLVDRISSEVVLRVQPEFTRLHERITHLDESISREDSLLVEEIRDLQLRVAAIAAPTVIDILEFAKEAGELRGRVERATAQIVDSMSDFHLLQKNKFFKMIKLLESITSSIDSLFGGASSSKPYSEVSATTGFITGHLMMFISIYYVPLHLALGRPHTITVLVLPYLLFHFFWNNHKNFFDYGSTIRNSMRNLSIQCVFLNNLIFQLFNHFILPSSTLARLVKFYMFRCNNKMLFVTSSFVGWLIGHILFMKWVGLVLFWIRQNHSIRSNKYLVSELNNSMARIFSILLFITCVYYLGRMSSPIVTKKLKETSEMEERGESEEESDIETTFEMKETKQEQEGSAEDSDFI